MFYLSEVWLLMMVMLFLDTVIGASENLVIRNAHIIHNTSQTKRSTVRNENGACKVITL